MRTPVVLALLASQASAEPKQLPKKCVAESPVDEPCTSLKGRYKIELSQRAGASKCVLTKPVSAVLAITSEGKKPAFDAQPLIKALGLRPRGKDDVPELGADIRDGVCCMDLRVYGRVGAHSQRVQLNLAAGARVVSARSKERWIADEGPDMCGDEELDVKVTKL
jgi:hypothetical protein